MPDNPYVFAQGPQMPADWSTPLAMNWPAAPKEPDYSSPAWASVLGKLNAMPAPSGGSMPSGNAGAVELYIRQAAAAQGLNPDVMVKVAKSEGLNSYIGDQGSSFGPFQLHYGGVAGGGNAVGGLGDTFTAMTGKNARDPSTIKDQVDFTMQYVKQHGLTPWHGWKGDPWAANKGQ